MPVEHFKSKEGYRKNMAYRHIHGIPFTAKAVVVAGKKHTVKHSASKSRRRIDAAQKRKVARRSDTHAFIAGRRA
jgi:hypothetical protein